jgi:hypothetical protein
MAPESVRRFAARGAFLAALVLVVACRQETILIAPPADTTHSGGGGGGGGGGGTVLRAPLAITVRMYPADSAVWNALGWVAGQVSRATVTIQRDGSSDPALTLRTDSGGVARFVGLLTGSYTASGLRILSAAERGQLPANDQDVEAIASGTRIVVDTPGTSATLYLPLSRRGSLVVSEYWFPLSLVEPPAFIYPFGGYVELYNNSDTTVYLDGLTFGDGLMKVTSQGSYNSCVNYADMMNDSTGVWAEDIFRFPGSGHDHPLAPGHAVVLATDAVDHRTVNDSASDLSQADFEFIGPSDVDNPAVPNMINLSDHVTPLGHGWYGPFQAAPFIAMALSPDTLPTRVVYTYSAKYYHIARAAVIGFSLFYTKDPRYTDCSPLVSPVFDAAPAMLPYADFYSSSFKRKVLRYLPDGRAVLQNTRTSAQDFEFTFPRTPGVVP